MTIDEMIASLNEIREEVGGNEEVPVMRYGCGENDYLVPDKLIVADLKDQDRNTFKCALVGTRCGEELTKVGIPHYNWNPYGQ